MVKSFINHGDTHGKVYNQKTWDFWNCLETKYSCHNLEKKLKLKTQTFCQQLYY